jgi:DnaJ-class molecular chaperone
VKTTYVMRTAKQVLEIPMPRCPECHGFGGIEDVARYVNPARKVAYERRCCRCGGRGTIRAEA